MIKNVSHLSHYKCGGYECLDIAKHFCFSLGCAYKYVWRAGKKGNNKDYEDYAKAEFYLNDFISSNTKPVVPLGDGALPTIPSLGEVELAFESPKRTALHLFHEFFSTSRSNKEIVRELVQEIRILMYSESIDKAAEDFAKDYNGEDNESSFYNGALWAIKNCLK